MLKMYIENAHNIDSRAITRTGVKQTVFTQTLGWQYTECGANLQLGYEESVVAEGDGKEAMVDFHNGADYNQPI